VISRDFAGRNLDELNHAASAREPASAITYPLVSRGERFPFVAPDAHGFVMGDPLDDADRFAAVLQGVGFIERLCFDYLDLLGAPTSGATWAPAYISYGYNNRTQMLRIPAAGKGTKPVPCSLDSMQTRS